MADPDLTPEEKDAMISWVCECAGEADKAPWWEHCSDPVAAMALVQAKLPHLLTKQPS